MTDMEARLTEALTYDGDEFELSDTLKLVLIIKHDYDVDINDYECYGKASKYAYDPRDDEYKHRPEGFTGRARKIEVDRGLIRWWEPYDGPYGYQDANGEWQSCQWEQLPKDERDRQVAFVTRLLRDGFKLVGLRAMELVTDSLGHRHWVKLDTVWLGGVDDVGPRSLPDILLDLTVEMPDVVTNALRGDSLPPCPVCGGDPLTAPPCQ